MANKCNADLRYMYHIFIYSLCAGGSKNVAISNFMVKRIICDRP